MQNFEEKLRKQNFNRKNFGSHKEHNTPCNNITPISGTQSANTPQKRVKACFHDGLDNGIAINKADIFTYAALDRRQWSGYFYAMLAFSFFKKKLEKFKK